MMQQYGVQLVESEKVNKSLFMAYCVATNLLLVCRSISRVALKRLHHYRPDRFSQDRTGIPIRTDAFL